VNGLRRGVLTAVEEAQRIERQMVTCADPPAASAIVEVFRLRMLIE
jgi:hypothetical protein